jgi:HD-like signal output (HDOD) protein
MGGSFRAVISIGRFISEGAQAIENVVAGGVPLVVAENMMLGTDHAEIGAQILAHWSFPSDIVNAVRLHHNPERVKHSNGQTEIVYLSNILCNAHGDGDSIKGHDNDPSPVVLKRLNINFSQYEIILERVCSWINKLSDTLNFD